MCGFTAAAAAALTVAVVAVYAGGAVHTLNGHNVEWPDTYTGNACAAGNVIGTRVQVWGDRAFVLTPRFRAGVPFTVSAVRLDRGADRCWPALAPYPSLSQHGEGDPDAVQNAVDMHLDPSGVLWVLDSGLVNTMEHPVRRAQPRIFAVDVKTDEVCMRGHGRIATGQKALSGRTALGLKKVFQYNFNTRLSHGLVHFY